MGNRDEVWNATWDTFYDSYYHVILFEKLSKRWQTVDFVTKLLVAITTSSSAIAGWSLWNDDDFKIIWIILAGLASFISIVHTILNVNEKVKKYSDLSNKMSLIKHDFESLQNEMKIYPDFNVDSFFTKLEILRDKYINTLENHSIDFLTTDKIRNESQDKLNIALNIQG